MEVSVAGLTIGYDGSPIVEGLSHEFQGSTVTALIGPSGSGKSTLLYTLALMLTPMRGHIVWGATRADALSDAERSLLRAQHSGFVFQDAVLDLAQTALENVLEAAWIGRMPKQEARDRAEALLERFGVADQTHRRPGQVSGGQAQRIALCRALIRRPAVLFADEPTGNLDPDTADVVWSALQESADEGTTVIVATHDQTRARMLGEVLDLGALAKASL